MLPHIESSRTETARRYEAPDIQPTMIVAWDVEAADRNPSLAPAVRPLRRSDTAKSIAGIAIDPILAPFDARRAATGSAGQLACVGFAWVACSGPVNGGEAAVPAYLESATVGDELGVDFATGRARRRIAGDELLGHAVYVTTDGATVIVRLAMAFTPASLARGTSHLDARAPLR